MFKQASFAIYSFIFLQPLINHAQITRIIAMLAAVTSLMFALKC